MDHLCYLCLMFVMLLRLFFCCFVVTCRERAGFLALAWYVYCDFVSFPFSILEQV